MEITTIESKTFERMLSEFERFTGRMEQLCHLHADKDIGQWLDNQDVCRLLGISPRTLQTLRDTGRLAYTRISHKIYYKPADVEKMLPVVEDRRSRAKHKGKQI